MSVLSPPTVESEFSIEMIGNRPTLLNMQSEISSPLKLSPPSGIDVSFPANGDWQQRLSEIFIDHFEIALLENLQGFVDERICLVGV